MAINLQKLIDISLLEYYDDKLKNWAIEKFSGGSSSIKFTTNANLPEQGESDVLYITEDRIKIWNGFTYVEISSGSGGESTIPDTWGDF